MAEKRVSVRLVAEVGRQVRGEMLSMDGDVKGLLDAARKLLVSLGAAA